jgi:multicomponent Na+:H+ antiporter subunit D
MYAVLPAAEPVTLHAPVSRLREAAALVLALCSLLLGLLPWQEIIPAPTKLTSAVPPLEMFVSALWLILAGAALALLLARPVVRLTGMPRGAENARRIAVPFINGAMRVDHALRQWLAAGLALLVVAISLGASIIAGR